MANSKKGPNNSRINSRKIIKIIKRKNCCGYIVRAESRWRINKKFAMSNKNKLIKNSK